MKKFVFGIFLFSFGIFSAQEIGTQEIDGPNENSKLKNAKGLTITPVEKNQSICLCCNKEVKNIPLIILDGQRIPYENFSKINPETIESMEVLKNEKAIELYGEDAKNGVILIKTKKQYSK